MKSNRIPCCVPFCRRTIATSPGYREFLCGPHLRLARPALRRRRALFRRRYKRAVLQADFPAALRAFRGENAIWDAIKKEAIERSAGISGLKVAGSG